MPTSMTSYNIKFTVLTDGNHKADGTDAHIEITLYDINGLPLETFDLTQILKTKYGDPTERGALEWFQRSKSYSYSQIYYVKLRMIHTDDHWGCKYVKVEDPRKPGASRTFTFNYGFSGGRFSKIVKWPGFTLSQKSAGESQREDYLFIKIDNSIGTTTSSKKSNTYYYPKARPVSNAEASKNKLLIQDILKGLERGSRPTNITDFAKDTWRTWAEKNEVYDLHNNQNKTHTFDTSAPPNTIRIVELKFSYKVHQYSMSDGVGTAVNMEFPQSFPTRMAPKITTTDISADSPIGLTEWDFLKARLQNSDQFTKAEIQEVHNKITKNKWFKKAENWWVTKEKNGWHLSADKAHLLTDQKAAIRELRNLEQEYEENRKRGKGLVYNIREIEHELKNPYGRGKRELKREQERMKAEVKRLRSELETINEKKQGLSRYNHKVTVRIKQLEGEKHRSLKFTQVLKNEIKGQLLNSRATDSGVRLGHRGWGSWVTSDPVVEIVVDGASQAAGAVEYALDFATDVIDTAELVIEIAEDVIAETVAEGAGFIQKEVNALVQAGVDTAMNVYSGEILNDFVDKLHQLSDPNTWNPNNLANGLIMELEGVANFVVALTEAGIEVLTKLAKIITEFLKWILIQIAKAFLNDILDLLGNFAALGQELKGKASAVKLISDGIKHSNSDKILEGIKDLLSSSLSFKSIIESLKDLDAGSLIFSIDASTAYGVEANASLGVAVSMDAMLQLLAGNTWDDIEGPFLSFTASTGLAFISAGKGVDLTIGYDTGKPDEIDGPGVDVSLSFKAKAGGTISVGFDPFSSFPPELTSFSVGLGGGANVETSIGVSNCRILTVIQGRNSAQGDRTTQIGTNELGASARKYNTATVIDHVSRIDQFWGKYSWAQLGESDKRYWKVLGYDQGLFPEVNTPRKGDAIPITPKSRFIEWRNLSARQQFAATRLGYTEATWKKRDPFPEKFTNPTRIIESKIATPFDHFLTTLDPNKGRIFYKLGNWSNNNHLTWKQIPVNPNNQQLLAGAENYYYNSIGKRGDNNYPLRHINSISFSFEDGLLYGIKLNGLWYGTKKKEVTKILEFDSQEYISTLIAQRDSTSGWKDSLIRYIKIVTNKGRELSVGTVAEKSSKYSPREVQGRILALGITFEAAIHKLHIFAQIGDYFESKTTDSES